MMMYEKAPCTQCPNVTKLEDIGPDSKPCDEYDLEHTREGIMHRYSKAVTTVDRLEKERRLDQSVRQQEANMKKLLQEKHAALDIQYDQELDNLRKSTQRKKRDWSAKEKESSQKARQEGKKKKKQKKNQQVHKAATKATKTVGAQECQAKMVAEQLAAEQLAAKQLAAEQLAAEAEQLAAEQSAATEVKETTTDEDESQWSVRYFERITNDKDGFRDA